MSWARFGYEGSDVYIFNDVRGGITCCSCQLQKEVPTRIAGFMLHDDFNCATEKEMYEHIRQHIAAGHCIPDYLVKEATEK